MLALTHKAAINNVKRFSIVSTYFPDDYSADGQLMGEPNKKIKRIIALPGETFKIEGSKLYVKKGEDFEYIPYTFTIDPSVDEPTTVKDIGEVTLGNDEYWALGDHRSNSRDCGSFYKDSGDVHYAAIKKSYLVGVLVAIEGQATLTLTSCVCDSCKKTYEKGVICPNCAHTLTRNFELKNKKYHSPKYF